MGIASCVTLGSPGLTSEAADFVAFAPRPLERQQDLLPRRLTSPCAPGPRSAGEFLGRQAASPFLSSLRVPLPLADSVLTALGGCSARPFLRVGSNRVCKDAQEPPGGLHALVS